MTLTCTKYITVYRNPTTLTSASTIFTTDCTIHILVEMNDTSNLPKDLNGAAEANAPSKQCSAVCTRKDMSRQDSYTLPCGAPTKCSLSYLAQRGPLIYGTCDRAISVSHM